MKDNPVVYVVIAETYNYDETQTIILKVFIQESEAKEYVKRNVDRWHYLGYERHQTS